MPLGIAGSMLGRVWGAGGPPPPPPAIIERVYPPDGTATDRIFVVLNDTTAVSSARLDGKRLVNFTVLTGTLANGRAPALPPGASSLTVMNTGGRSDPFLNAFTYTRPTARLGTPTSRPGHMRLGIVDDLDTFTSRLGTERSKLGNTRLGTGT